MLGDDIVQEQLLDYFVGQLLEQGSKIDPCRNQGAYVLKTQLSKLIVY
jgi:hypothetical protein